MRKSIFLICLLATGPVRADTAMAAVSDLGRINGIALACGHPQVVARAKELMIAHVPKTRAYGEAYEAATSQGYLQLPGGCGDAAALRLEAELAAGRIQAALPAGK